MWLLILLVLIVVGMAVAFIVIKRQQGAPFRSFAETVTVSADALRQKPKSIYFRSSATEKGEVPFHPEKQETNSGHYKLVYDGIALLYQYEQSTEFLDLTGDELTHVGIQYIEGDPKEIYLDDQRVEERHHYLEEHTGDMMGIRRLIRKHLKIQDTHK
jgi:hypothetical protein